MSSYAVVTCCIKFTITWQLNHTPICQVFPSDNQFVITFDITLDYGLAVMRLFYLQPCYCQFKRRRSMAIAVLDEDDMHEINGVIDINALTINVDRICSLSNSCAAVQTRMRVLYSSTLSAWFLDFCRFITKRPSTSF